MGHPQWIEEVWVNLVSNALKYGGTPPVIKLGYEKAYPASYQVLDTGQWKWFAGGITEEDL